MNAKFLAGLSLLLVACTPAGQIRLSRVQQTTDVLCASAAAAVNAVRGDTVSARLALACLDRLERNEAVEEALRTSLAGATSTAPPVAGAAGASP